MTGGKEALRESLRGVDEGTKKLAEQAVAESPVLEEQDVSKVLQGIEVEKPLPEDIPEDQKDRIGGSPGDVHDIRGKPIDLGDAARIQAAETVEGHDIGKGSLAARAQAAAAFNQRENIVPGKGGTVGIDNRGVRTGHEAELMINQKTTAGDRKYN